MGYWDDTTASVTATTKKEIVKCEVFGVEPNIRVVIHADQVTLGAGGVVLGRESLPPIVSDSDLGDLADPTIGPILTKILTGFRQLARAKRNN